MRFKLNMNPDDVYNFSATLLEVLYSIDRNGYIKRDKIRSLFEAVNKMSKISKRNIMFAPEKYLPSFFSLHPNAQNTIINAIAREDRWCMIGHELGKWHIMATKLFQKLYRKLLKYRFYRLSNFAQILSIISQSGPAHFLHAIYNLQVSLQEKFSFRPSFQAFIKKLKIEPWNLAVCYARYIPQIEAYRGFFHDAFRHNTYGLIVGIDLIPSSKGIYFIESNLNFGMSNKRSALYEKDPFVQNLIRFTIEHGYKHLIFMNNTSSYMNKTMAQQLEEEASEKKIKLTIVEDAYLPKGKYFQSYEIPEINSNDTLIVRTKFYRTSFDHLLQNKRANIRALNIYKQEFEDPYLLIPSTSNTPVIENVNYDMPFPNLVFKLPERDEGKGLIFLKAISSEHALKSLEETISQKNNKGFINHLYSLIEDRNGIFQSYISSHMLDGRKLYKVRSHVLITPVGLKFLSAHRVISRYSVPDNLPFGVVKDPRPYLINLASSSAYDICPSDENQKIEKATLSVAKGLAWAINYGFQTTP
ncbi:MAG: hypothetical protein ACPL1B_10670 [Thermoprotei archaeon]